MRVFGVSRTKAEYRPAKTDKGFGEILRDEIRKNGQNFLDLKRKHKREYEEEMHRMWSGI